MGTYLSTPVTEKCQEAGHDLDSKVVPCRWAVVDMQGWRKSMEDAHIAQTAVVDGNTTEGELKVFGVFDGHGGPEVAKFCQLYLVNVLIELSKESQEKKLTGENVGDTLKATFHALDRMIDQDARRDELLFLRTDKLQPGETRPIGSVPIPKATGEPIQVRGGIGAPVHVPVMDKDEPHVTSLEEVEEDGEASNNNDEVDKKTLTDDDTTEESSLENTSPEVANEGTSGKSNVMPENMNAETETSGSEDGDTSNGDDSEDADSDDAVGLDEAAKLDQDLMKDDDDDTDASSKEAAAVDVVNVALGEPASPKSRKVSGMFKFLSLKSSKSKGQIPAKARSSSASLPGQPTEGFRASIIQNGRQICNLPDHPIHAGCTAVVAVLIDRTLTIANAGDSRAVLCRVGGLTEPLSFDHKPQQDRELSRIRKAGGFVNQFGRVNGNLNLSRSIGDLKYKQVPGIPPAEQMITAEPDIVQTTLHPQDEFIIIGCDGIWDCLINEQAVRYVRSRIDKKTPTEIGIEMLDEIISEDPRATQGIGGDNMTIMIVDLQPQSRPYSASSPA